MNTSKKDLQPYKNKLMELTYNEKIEISEWLHTQIDFERGHAVKEKIDQLEDKMNNLFDKAAIVTKTAGNNVLDSFKSITSNKSEGDK